VHTYFFPRGNQPVDESRLRTRSQQAEHVRARSQWGVAALGSAVTTAVLYGVVFQWGGFARKCDFFVEAWPAYRALAHRHVVEFLRLGPAYFGSLILRAPFALVASALGGGPKAVYFATALPCLIAAVIFGSWLAVQPRRHIGHGISSRVSPLVLCIFNPIILMCVIFGHPEDVLGAVLCIAAVLLSQRGAAGWAGLLIGLAVANKSWAVIVVPVVLAALPSGYRRALLVMSTTAGLILVPAILVRQHGIAPAGAATTLGSQVGSTFLYPQLLWWFGPTSWIARNAHVDLVLVCGACTLLWWMTRFAGRWSPARDVDSLLLLLAFVLLLRAALDPWDNIYYHAPFLLALMAYESRRTPWLTSICSAALLIVIPPAIISHISLDWRAGAYAIAVVPVIAGLALRLYVPQAAWNSLSRRLDARVLVARRATS